MFVWFFYRNKLVIIFQFIVCVPFFSRSVVKVLLSSHYPTFLVSHFSNHCCFLLADLNSFRALLQNLTWLQKAVLCLEGTAAVGPLLFSFPSVTFYAQPLSLTGHQISYAALEGLSASPDEDSKVFPSRSPFFFFSFPSSCPIPWRHAKSLPCFKNAVVSFHWASCGIVSTEIALILSEPCPIQRLYPAWFLVTTAPGQKFSVFLVCHLQSWQFVLSCVSVCVYTYGVGLASHTLLRWWAFWVSCLLLHRIISIFSALCFYLAKKKRWLG